MEKRCCRGFHRLISNEARRQGNEVEGSLVEGISVNPLFIAPNKKVDECNSSRKRVVHYTREEFHPVNDPFRTGHGGTFLGGFLE
jgi:hypothetical protein